MLKYRKGSRVPYSTAKTAYGLCADVIKAVLEEPRRAYMPMVIKDYFKGDKPSRVPPCGTAGCLMGWIGMLSAPNLFEGKLNVMSFVRRAVGSAVCSFEEDTLNGEVNYRVPAFVSAKSKTHSKGDTVYVFDAGGDLLDAGLQVGTKAYAEAVVTRMKHFMKNNKQFLKDRKL